MLNELCLDYMPVVANKRRVCAYLWRVDYACICVCAFMCVCVFVFSEREWSGLCKLAHVDLYNYVLYEVLNSYRNRKNTH